MRRDVSFEALVEVTGANISSERGALNRALKDIREVEPLEDEDLAILIRLRAGEYRKAWPEMALTPTALAKHWNRIEKEKPKPTYAEPQSRYAPVCQVCDGVKMVLVGYRPALPTAWSLAHGIEPSKHPNERGHEEWAPCPQCNSEANAEFWREDGSRFRPLDPALVRERMEQ